MAEEKHEHGKMNIEVQEKTFEGFVRAVSWGTGICAVALVLLYLING